MDRKKLKVGNILYLGHNGDTDRCPYPYRYEGQLGKQIEDGVYVAYFSSYENVAEGYARCVGKGKGWVNKYEVTKPFSVLDMSDDMLHYDADEVAEEFCPTGGGYYIKWSDTSDEYAICNPELFLKYVGSKKCISHGRFEKEYVCD